MKLFYSRLSMMKVASFVFLDLIKNLMVFGLRDF